MRSLLLYIPLITVGCHFGDSFETLCIKGRLSPLQAEHLNQSEWERKPGYCRGNTYTDDDGIQRNGEAHCDAEPGDRVLSASCSSALKILRTGD